MCGGDRNLRSHFFPNESIAGWEYFCFPPDSGSGNRVRHVTNNPVYLLFYTPRNCGPLILRMVVAGYFFLHGAQQTLGWFGGLGWNTTLEAWTAASGPAWPFLFIALFLAGELLVSFLLFLGFFTRLAGAGTAAIMFLKIAILTHHAPDLTSYELPIMVGTIGIALLCLGGGALSTDRAISENLLPVVG